MYVTQTVWAVNFGVSMYQLEARILEFSMFLQYTSTLHMYQITAYSTTLTRTERGLPPELEFVGIPTLVAKERGAH